MKRFLFFCSCLPAALALLLGGCGSSEDTNRMEVRPDSTVQRKASFETQTDTVTAQSALQHKENIDPQNPEQLGFMVQIGSFRKSANANHIRALARKRFKFPVIKEYNASKRKYQIRIGFFKTEQAADEFRLRIIKEFPMDYKGAWVVRANK